jgi:hypothetical protein
MNEALNCISWDQTLSFPIKMKDLSLDALLVFTIWTPDNRIYGGTSLRIFDDNGCLKQGKQKLLVFQKELGDANVVYRENCTPGEYYEKNFMAYDFEFQMEKNYETYRLKGSSNNLTGAFNSVASNSVNATNSASNTTYGNNATSAPYSSVGVSNTDWLDRLLLKRIEQVNHKKPRLLFRNQEEVGDSMEDRIRHAQYTLQQNELMQKYFDELSMQSLEELELKNFSFLVVELPTLLYPVSFLHFRIRIRIETNNVLHFIIQVIYEDRQYPTVDPHYPPNSYGDLLKDFIVGSENDPYIEFQLTGRQFNPSWLTVVADWDMDQVNEPTFLVSSYFSQPRWFCRKIFLKNRIVAYLTMFEEAQLIQR